MECSRKNVKIVLNRMINAKANHLFELNNVVYGRCTRVLKHWWLRGLEENQDSIKSWTTNSGTLKKEFKTWLEWDPKIDGDFFDRQGVSLLDYAVSADNLEATKYLLDEIEKNFKRVMSTLDVLNQEFEMRDMSHSEFQEVRQHCW